MKQALLALAGFGAVFCGMITVLAGTHDPQLGLYIEGLGDLMGLNGLGIVIYVACA